jgi:hypothetical protein
MRPFDQGSGVRHASLLGALDALVVGLSGRGRGSDEEEHHQGTKNTKGKNFFSVNSVSPW